MQTVAGVAVQVIEVEARGVLVVREGVVHVTQVGCGDGVHEGG